MVRNMDFNIAAVCMTALIYIFFRLLYRHESKNNQWFRILVLEIFMCALGNIVADESLLLYGKIPLFINYLLYCPYLIMVNCAPFILTKYTECIVRKTDHERKKDFWWFLNWALLGIHTILSILTVPFHIYIQIDDNGNFHTGKLYIIVYLISGYYLLYSFINIFIYIKVLSRKQIVSVVAFVFLTFTGALSQYFVFDQVNAIFDRPTIIIYFIYALSLLILQFCFETPDYEKLIETTKNLEESHRELEAAKERAEELATTVHQLMKTASWVIYFGDRDEAVAEWSPEFLHMLGYEEGEYIGDVSMLWADSLHPDDKEETMAAFIAGMQGAVYKKEARLRDRNGNYRWYLCTGELKSNSEGKPTSYQGIIQDIEDEKYKNQLIEERLQAANELEKSQTELKKALIAAEEASNAKTTFLSNMSHDIRTPMNAIIGFTQLALEDQDNKEKLIDSLKTIQSSGNHLLSLINDVLDMSRIESGKVKVEPVPCNLSEFVDDIGKLINSNIIEHRHTYSSDASKIVHPYVICDRLRLNQVLINCLGNSVKYTKDGGKISLTVSEKICEDHSDFTFVVEDNGIGMSEEFLKKIFEPFERDRNTNTAKIQGTGLGMAITKNLVDMMGGRIEVESKVNVGSKFIITIPMPIISAEKYNASAEKEEEGPSQEEMEKALKGKHFLVVDDNELNRKLIIRLLTDRGMLIDSCDSGAAAIEKLTFVKPGDYDMVFMDIQMPGMDGYTTTDTLRKIDNPVLKELPIIAMTANAFEEDKQRTKEHGMNGHVTKPIKIKELVRILYKLLT